MRSISAKKKKKKCCIGYKDAKKMSPYGKYFDETKDVSFFDKR